MPIKLKKKKRLIRPEGRPRKYDPLVLYDKYEKVINTAWKKKNPTLLNRYVNPILDCIEKELKTLPLSKSLKTTRYLLEDLARVLRIYQIQAYEPIEQEDPMVVELETTNKKPQGVEFSGPKSFTPWEKKVSEPPIPNFSSDHIEELNQNENDENPQIDQNEVFFPTGINLPTLQEGKIFNKMEISDSPWEKTLEEKWNEWEGEEDLDDVSKEYREGDETEEDEWEDVEDEEVGEDDEGDETEGSDNNVEGNIRGGGVVRGNTKEDRGRDMRDVFPTTSTFSHPVQSATSAPDTSTSTPEVPVSTPDITSTPEVTLPSAMSSPYDELLHIDISENSFSEPPPQIFPPEEKASKTPPENTPEEFSGLDKMQRIKYKLKKWKESRKEER